MITIFWWNLIKIFLHNWKKNGNSILWFTKYSGQELPLISLDKSKIQIEIELKAVNKLYTIIEKKELILENSLDIDGNIIDHSSEKKLGKNSQVLYDNNTINYEQRVAPIKKTDKQWDRAVIKFLTV